MFDFDRFTQRWLGTAATALLALPMLLIGGTASSQDRGWREAPPPPPYAQDGTQDDDPPSGSYGRRNERQWRDDDSDGPPPPVRDARGRDRGGWEERSLDERDERAERRSMRRGERWRDDDGRDSGYGDATQTGAVDAPDTRVFRDELEGLGRWEDDAEFGQVWVPEDVGEDWRPYTRGQWAYTADYGWYWVSDEPWGWATYHYGRWGYDARRHWFWVPDTTWGPAWVAWRYSDDYLGWAPLPPGLGRDRLEGPRLAHYWIFVRPRFFAVGGLARFVQPPYVTDHILPRTRPAGGVTADGTHVVNRGVPMADIERLTGRPPRTYRPVFARRDLGRRAMRPGLGTIDVYAPRWGVPPRAQRAAVSTPEPKTSAAPASSPPSNSPPRGAARPDGVTSSPAGATGTHQPAATSTPPRPPPTTEPPPAVAAGSAATAAPSRQAEQPAAPAAAKAPQGKPALYPGEAAKAAAAARSAAAAPPPPPVASPPSPAPDAPAASDIGSPSMPRIINKIAEPAAAPSGGAGKEKP